mmetsp:Transcript_14242/g.28415  ORF Transcript_14242/g.28415 Transcript_14242/m.28415 type:complete len:589 (-) Transcript_14242:116-1882(-)
MGFEETIDTLDASSVVVEVSKILHRWVVVASVTATTAAAALLLVLLRERRRRPSILSQEHDREVKSLRRRASESFLPKGYRRRRGRPRGAPEKLAPDKPNATKNLTSYKSSLDDAEKVAQLKDHISIVALDCEMVGAALSRRTRRRMSRYEQNRNGGTESMLARCSLVTVADDGKSCRILYDVAVKPTRPVVDYRTEWSGITKEILEGKGGLEAVSFSECRGAVASILGGESGRLVLLAGHGLENDFGVLQLSHPGRLVRDTAHFMPYMTEGKGGKKWYARKLVHLAEEELGEEIQRGSEGHSSTEDAFAALRLYFLKREEWEARLGHPLNALLSLKDCKPVWPSITLYFDAGNLPFRLQRGNCVIGILSERRDVCKEFDWIPLFQEMLLNGAPAVGKIVIIVDGSNFRHDDKHEIPQNGELSPGLFLEITKEGVSTHDVLAEKCVEQPPSSLRPGEEISPEEVVDLYGKDPGDIPGLPDALNSYVVLKRTGRCRSKHKKLFNKLGLHRPSEGVHCLLALTPALCRSAYSTSKELGRVEGLIACEKRWREDLRQVVVTDDTVLAQRMAEVGWGVLGSRQMGELKISCR